jgi:hypothetical protein
LSEGAAVVEPLHEKAAVAEPLRERAEYAMYAREFKEFLPEIGRPVRRSSALSVQPG